MNKLLRGVHSMSYEQYDKAPGLRQSRLKAMAKSAAHFKAESEADCVATRDTILGHIFHTAVLEPKRLDKSYWLRPETYENKKGEIRKWNGNATECKYWLAAHDDREVLLHREHDAIIGMKKSVMEHPAARLALAEGVSEQCLFHLDPGVEIGLKCMCDRLTGNTIVDLKSAIDASPEGFARSVAKFGYDVQAAFYLDIATGLGLGKEYFVFIAVEKEPPYAVAVYQLDEESIEVGRKKYRRWLSLLSHCLTMNEWPGYSPDIVRLSLPQWHIKQENNLLYGCETPERDNL